MNDKAETRLEEVISDLDALRDKLYALEDDDVMGGTADVLHPYSDAERALAEAGAALANMKIALNQRLT